jgi:hypothetical protein
MLGVPNPRVARIHPYPTRYHGTITVRPTFAFPYVRSVHRVMMPSDFHGLGIIPEHTTQALAVGAAAAALGYAGMRYYLKKRGR